VEKKGLSVVRRLADMRPDLRFVLAGRGPINPGSWALTNVTDVGTQSQEELAELYRRADCLLLPSVGEGYPLVIQEAMSSGLPVICAHPCDRADPDAAAWLRGVKIDLRDPTASARRCSAAIDEVLKAPPYRMAVAAYAANRYSWPAVAQELVDYMNALS
jgi:glycosyltransferase involved in cell wall biosynthesis